MAGNEQKKRRERKPYERYEYEYGSLLMLKNGRKQKRREEKQVSLEFDWRWAPNNSITTFFDFSLLFTGNSCTS